MTHTENSIGITGIGLEHLEIPIDRCCVISHAYTDTPQCLLRRQFSWQIGHQFTILVSSCRQLALSFEQTSSIPGNLPVARSLALHTGDLRESLDIFPWSM